LSSLSACFTSKLRQSSWNIFSISLLDNVDLSVVLCDGLSVSAVDQVSTERSVFKRSLETLAGDVEQLSDVTAELTAVCRSVVDTGEETWHSLDCSEVSFSVHCSVSVLSVLLISSLRQTLVKMFLSNCRVCNGSAGGVGWNDCSGVCCSSCVKLLVRHNRPWHVVSTLDVNAVDRPVWPELARTAADLLTAADAECDFSWLLNRNRTGDDLVNQHRYTNQHRYN